MPRRSRAVAAFSLGVAVAAISFNTLPHLPAQQKATPPVVPPSYPTLTTPNNLGAKPGATAEIVLTGTHLTAATGVWTNFGGKAVIPDGQKDATKLTVKLSIPADTPTGVHAFRVATTEGVSNLRPFVVDDLPVVAETDKNRARGTPQSISAPCVVTGTATAEASDFFKFSVSAGKPITVEVLGRRLGSPIDPVILLYDGTGKELGGVYADDTPGLQSDPRVTLTPKASGEVIVEVRDTTYRGGGDYAYRLRVGEFPGATTAFPLAVQRGKPAVIGFAGPALEGVLPVNRPAAVGPVLSVAPRRQSGVAGWPVPVLIVDHPETTEQEPNNAPAQANKLPVPGGVSARFGEKNDVDHFAFVAKKGQKTVLEALTFQVNSPAEVYLRVLDAKGGELAKSNPQQASTRIEFTAPADGEFVVACEHLNYLAGPTEVYHLSATPAAPDFAVTVGLDRIDIPLGSVGLLPITGISKQYGFAAPVELTLTGSDVLTGSLTVPAGANPQPTAPLYVPVTLKAGTKATPGPIAVQLQATAKVGDTKLVRLGSVADSVKAAFGNMPNPPTEFETTIAAAVVPAPAFTLTVALDHPEVAAGGTVKGKVTAARADKFDDVITLVQVAVPANVTLKLAPVAKGAKEVAFELTAAANATVGPGEVVLRGTAKVGGKDVTVAAVPVTVTVSPAKKKEEPKKAEPKKGAKK